MSAAKHTPGLKELQRENTRLDEGLTDTRAWLEQARRIVTYGHKRLIEDLEVRTFLSESEKVLRRTLPASDKQANRQPDPAPALADALEAFVARHAEDCCSGADSEYPEDCDECAAAKNALRAVAGRLP